MSADFVFDLRGKSESALAPPATAIALARAIVSDLDDTWRKGKLFTPAPGIEVQTYARTLYSEKWFARRSIHRDVPYDWFKAGLCDNHCDNEVEYIETFESFTEFKPLSADGPAGLWRGILPIYKMPFPLKKRELPTWVLATQPDPHVNEFFVISVPAKQPAKPEYVQGGYSSVEFVSELPDGSVQWTVALVSDGGGSIPKWIQDFSVPAIIAEDVPSFINWAKKKYVAE
ncbi:uncharacterized protein V1518DRAFT_412320 [Limtongia smithiae]|uniref:uncharacterized protein n=1 Tax=Limtongia smithiae TaxID=1125753 RepID=UPI0034CD31C8